MSEEEAAAWRPARTRESLELLFETRHGDLDILFGSLAPDGRSEIDYRALTASAVPIESQGRTVAVASAEHLIASKLAARRPKDVRAREELERLLVRDAG